MTPLAPCPGILARTSTSPQHTKKMAAVVTSSMAARVVAGSAASGSRARGAANLKAVKMGKTTKRGALVVSAVRFPSLIARRASARAGRALAPCPSTVTRARATWLVPARARGAHRTPRAIADRPIARLHGPLRVWRRVWVPYFYLLSHGSGFRPPRAPPLTTSSPIDFPAQANAVANGYASRSSRRAPTRRRSSPSTATWRPSPPT